MKLFARRSASPVSKGYALIDEQLTVAGNISTDGTVRVEGRIEGTLHHAGKLIVGAAAVVIGDVEAHEIIIAGVLTGNLRVSGRAEVQATATVSGDIHAASVMLQDGGTVHGHLLVHPLDSDPAMIADEHRPTMTPSRAVAAASNA